MLLYEIVMRIMHLAAIANNWKCKRLKLFFIIAFMIHSPKWIDIQMQIIVYTETNIKALPDTA